MPEQQLEVTKKPKKPATNAQSFWFRISLTILGTVAFTIASWAVSKTICLTEDIAALRVEIKSLDEKIETEIRSVGQRIQDALDDKDEESRQKATLSKHWKLHSWERDEISAIKHKLEMGEAKWPDFKDD